VNIFEFAMQMEHKHYHIFKKLRSGESAAAIAVGKTHSKTLAAVKSIFVELSNSTEHASFSRDERSIWAEALKIEEQSEKFYREKAEEEDDVRTRNLLNMIANEERNHIYLIDSVLTYMKFPDTFSDTAQFKDFQSLEGH
jgi:rubrerythrin